MRNGLRTAPVATVAALGLLVSACGSGSTSSGPGSSAKPSTAASGGPAKHYTFDLITKSNASPYWLAVKDGADAAAAKLGNVKITFEAPASGTDLATQINMVDEAVVAHSQGIILAAQSPSGLLAPVKHAEAAGVPVITVDSGVSPNVANSFLATSNTQSSAALAKYTAKLAGGSGQYGIVDFNTISSTGIARPKGFRLGMSSEPGFKFIGQQISNNSVSTARAEASAMLQSHPGLTLLFGANDRSALGVAEAVQATPGHRVVVAGFDADLGEVNYIKSGVISASVLQSPYQMGYQAVTEMVRIKEGKSVPKRVDTPYTIVTRHNISSAAAVKAIQQYIPSYKG